MSEESSHAERIAAQTPGEWLRQERERQGLAKQRVADDLHLSTQMVEAIENNQFSRLGAPVFARGHLRKYALLLSLPVDRVHELYQTLNDRPHIVDPVPAMHRSSEPSIPMSPDSQQRRAAQHPTRRMVLLAIALFIVAVIAVWWWWQGSRIFSSPAVVAAPAIVPASTEILTPVAMAAPVNVEPFLQTAAMNSSGNNSSTLNATNTAATPPIIAAHSKLRIRFLFNNESWVEVYDARGTRVLYDEGRSRQSRSVDVESPAQVALGTASAVTVQVNGHTVAVPARRIINAVARFTLAADGAIE